MYIHSVEQLGRTVKTSSKHTRPSAENTPSIQSAKSTEHISWHTICKSFVIHASLRRKLDELCLANTDDAQRRVELAKFAAFFG